MKIYQEMLSYVLACGERRINRTGIDTLGVFGAVFEHDCRTGFPLLTTKRVPFKAVIAELCGFLEGATSAARFRELGTKIWDQNANENKAWLANPNRKGEDDLGRIYGAQWRSWFADGGSSIFAIDQIQNLIDGLINDPQSRRHIVTAWNPGEVGKMALPPCHILFQCNVTNDNHLDLMMYQRSADLFLGVPFNIASYAALLHFLAHCAQLRPGKLHIVFGDLHIYENHIEQCSLQVSREPRILPELTIAPRFALHNICPEAFQLHGYDPHDAIKADMAV